MSVIDWFWELEYPHWIMVVGGILVALGFFGFAFSRNRIPPPGDQDAPRPKAQDDKTV
jgi:hypothetical protein